jgi:hypothetical protein
VGQQVPVLQVEEARTAADSVALDWAAGQVEDQAMGAREEGEEEAGSEGV